MRRLTWLPAAAALWLGLALPGDSRAAGEQQSLEELRDTVINLLQALVDQGVLSRDKAAQLVKQAQEKAAASAAATAKAEEGAVRVPYVPQIVKDEISKQVAAEVRPSVVAEVLADAKQEKWGVPGAMPDWLSRTRLYGDVSVRNQSDLTQHDNVADTYLDFNAVNSKGGIIKAGPSAFLDTTQNLNRTRVRARLGLEATVAPDVTAGFRISSGGFTDPGSEFQTLGNYAERYTLGLDQAYVRFERHTVDQFPWLTVTGGRMLTPWFTPTDLVFHKELNFEGVAATGRLGFGDGSAAQSHGFLTLAALPLGSVVSNTKSKDKWMMGGQLGISLRSDGGQRFRLATAYFDYLNVSGVRNDPESTLRDYTAPFFVRVGNSMFDIRNTTDTTQNLFALAAQFRLVDVAATYELPLGRPVLSISAEAVQNVGFDSAEILRRTGALIAKRNKGYQAEIGLGDLQIAAAGQWRARVGYRYLQRDAVIDAFTDSDFRGGGTDAAGYYFIGDLGVASQTWLRLRYLAGHEIDGAPFALDTVQFDINTRF